MKFTLSWLEQHLATKASLEGILAYMMQCGLEVEEVVNPAADLSAFTVAKVGEVVAHPDADKLRVCTVETVDGTKQIVCGAPNARAGMTAIYAPLGTWIPGLNFALDKKPRKIRGIESHGMLCSAKELGAGEDDEGIADLDEGFALGTPAATALGVDDPIIDFEVTPNRPDWLGVGGIARDLAAAGAGRVITKAPKPIAGKGECPVDIKLEAEAACPIFGLVLIKGVTNGPSPDWMQRQLLAIGITPRSLLVDITNFISYDRARPLHVFDADKVTGDLTIRMGRSGEELVALDGKTYPAGEEMCVIADDTGVISFAGVMGGESTSVTDETVNVLIESAWFDPLKTARAGRTSNILSDARYRFERGVDPLSVDDGLAQATELITKYAGGQPTRPHIVGEVFEEREKLTFWPEDVARLTGMEVKPADMKRMLKDLGFDIEDAGEAWYVRPPSWRFDMQGSADFVEEIARLNGFDKLPEASLPPLAGGRGAITTVMQERVRVSRRTLAARGFLETVTWSFMPKSGAERFGGGAEALSLSNPVASELNHMRPSVLPNLAKAIQRDRDRGGAGIRLFEAGPVYLGDGPGDQRTVMAALAGAAKARNWQGASRAYDAYAAKGDLFALLEAMGQPPQRFQIIQGAASGHWHPGQSAALKLGPKTTVAEFGALHPGVLKALDVDGPLFGFELVLNALPTARSKGAKTKPVLERSDLLSVHRDLAFIVNEEVAAGDLVRAAKGADKSFITDVRVFDVYQGKGVEAGCKSIAIELDIQPKDTTLKDAEIDAIMQKAIKAIESAVGGVLRG